jgi:diguanylate cyclase
MAAQVPNISPDAMPMSDALSHARAAFASLQRHGLTPVPLHYGLWFEHHAGARPELCAALDDAVARGAVDEALMRELHGRFVVPLPEFTALGAALAELSGTLKEALGTMASHGADSAAFSDALEELSVDSLQDPRRLRVSLLRLAEQARVMTRRSLGMGRSIAQSSEQIEALRSELEDARRDAETDALTGLSNRRAFDLRLASLAHEAAESGAPLTLILIDIDRFKSVNDRFGHPVGDALLRRTASTLSATLCEHGPAARFGGEEFAVLLPGMRGAEAFKMAEQLRLAVAAQTFALRTTGTRLGDVTVSLGLAMLRPHEDGAGLIERADAALYRAKQEGRNRCCVDGQAGASAARAAVWS